MNIDLIFEKIIEDGKFDITNLDNIGMIQEDLENRSIETGRIDNFLIWTNKPNGWRKGK